MGNLLEESLFSRQPKQFESISTLAKSFAANFCGTTIVRDSIFGIAENYARKSFVCGSRGKRRNCMVSYKNGREISVVE